MAVPKKKLYERYLARLKPLLSTSPSAEISSILAGAKTTVLRMSRYESSAFDTSWIDAVEDVILDLGDIISNPRIITQEEGNLTPIELAKKTKGESVQHLASHTQYIKTIEEDGSVVPSKIISFVNEDFLYTYENRFIATLIRRLLLFIERRYQFVLAYIPLHQEEVMMVKTKAKIGDEEVEIETRIKSKALSADQGAAKAAEIAQRIRNLREYVTFYYGSPFMRQMKTERDVRKPIILTNILRKNVKYHKCYELFSFLERYDTFGMNYNADERYFALSEEQLHDFALVQLGEYFALQDGREFDVVKAKQHSYKPRFLSSIDDEQFVFGELPKGPIQFVRVDEEYRNYLNSTVRTDIPSRPNKYEKEYYADEIDYRREVKEEQKAIDRLLRRKTLAAGRFEKAIKAIVAKREEEEALLHRMEEEERLDLEEAILAKKRAEIRNAAYDEKDAALEEEPIVEAPEAVEEDKPEPEEAPTEEPIVVEEAIAPEEEAFAAPNEETAESPREEASIASEEETLEAPNEETAEASQEEQTPQAIEAVEEASEKPQEEQTPQEEPQNGDEEPVSEEKKAKKSRKNKPNPKTKPSPEPQPSPEATPEETPIPGRFVVKTNEGYFVREGVYTKNKAKAHIFNDFAKARQEKKRLGGKVVKL